MTWWQNVAQRRSPDFVIGDKNDPYMLRWYLFRPWPYRFANVYLHRFLRSDYDEALHDHPYANMSYLLQGTYVEHTIAKGGVHSKRQFSAGDWTLRRAVAAHRIEIITDPVKEPIWSLFITGPVIREWGFHCPQGWKRFKDFVELREGGSGLGKGCGE